MSVQLNLDGLHRVAKELPNAIVDALNSAAESMESLAKQLAPVDTGFLRDHISQTEFAKPDSLRASVESEADHSLYVEHGTVNSEAQPFFTPAFESAKRQLTNMKRVV